MPIINIKDVGQYGVIADQEPHELPVNAFSDSQNMRFRDGYAERFKGQQTIFDVPAVTPYFITPFSTTTSRYWIHCGTNAVYADDGVTRTDITPLAGPTLSGAVDDRWTGGVLNGVLVLNNGVNTPYYWGGDPATNLVDLPGWLGWTAGSIRPFKNYLVAVDFAKGATKYPHMVKWSHVAEPGTIPLSWNETDATKDAGEVDQAETPDLMVDSLPLGDVLILYKERSMYAMQFVGQPSIFRFTRLPGDVGMLARGCAVQVPQGHVVLAAGDVVIHNGQGPQSILTAKWRKTLFESIDSTYYKRSFVCSNPAKNEVWICYPEIGQSTCTKALVWNYVDNTFGTRELNNVTYGAAGQINYTTAATWAADAETWDQDASLWDQDEYSPTEARLLLTSTAPHISIVDTGATFNQVTPTAFLERTGLHFDDPDSVKTIRGVRPRIDAVAGTQFSIEVGAAMDTESNVTWSAPVTYTVGSSFKADAFATGRYLAYRITSTSPQPWRMKSPGLDVVVRGEY